ncbi:MAG TPA: FGGY family carbohydrate kinase [Feifaniaceae bacterium]|nr:FGGY family carbohydrate kinase [Feifaniaceae bacterium]
MTAYLIGVDIGTQGTKAALFDTDINLLATAFEPSRILSPAPGTAWQEADDLYASCANTIRSLMEQTGVSPSDIAAIGLDGQMAGIMGVDAEGEASTYYDSWLDMRCGKYMEGMRQTAGRRVTELTGGPVTYTHGPKILWWKHEHPDAYKRTAKFVLPHVYIVGKMTGTKGRDAYFDYTHLHFSGFGDNAKKEWSDELLCVFGVEKEKMARVVSPFEVIGKTTRAFANISGTAEGIPVVAGCGDTAASTFGSGMFERDLVLDCAGTASVLCSVVNGFVPDTRNETMTMMRSPVDGLWLPLAYINGGGMCIRWFRDTLSGRPAATYDELEAEAAPLSPGSEGLLFLPHFSGRVLPNNPDLKGSFLGLDFKHTRGHMYRSVLESIAYEYKYYLRVLRTLYPGSDFSRMLSIGGGSNSPLFNAIKADVLGIAVETFETGETALVGSAVIAGIGAGALTDYKKPIQGIMKKKNSFAPEKSRHAQYAPYAEAYLAALEHVTQFYRSDPFQLQGID